MKYRLLKDLPFAKAGEEVLSNEPPAKRINDDTDKSFIMVATQNEYGLRHIEIPRDKIWDWLEEVKPREWLITIDNESGQILHYPGIGTVIKVREVLDGD